MNLEEKNKSENVPKASPFSRYVPADETFCPTEPPRRVRVAHSTPWRSKVPLSDVTTEPVEAPEISLATLARAQMPPPGGFISASLPFSPTPYHSSRRTKYGAGQNSQSSSSLSQLSSGSVSSSDRSFSSNAAERTLPSAQHESGRSADDHSIATWTDHMLVDETHIDTTLPCSGDISPHPLAFSFAQDVPMSDFRDAAISDPPNGNTPSHPPNIPSLLPWLKAAGLKLVPDDTSGRERSRSAPMSMDERVSKALELFDHRGGSGAFLEHLFTTDDPNLKRAASGFLSSKHFQKVLDLWWSSNDGHDDFEEWMGSKADDLVMQRISDEMDALAICYQFRVADATPQYLLDFDLESIIEPLVETCAPFTYSVLIRALQSDRAARENTHKSPNKIALVIISQLVKHRTQRANLFAVPYALTQWAAGAPRQIIDASAKIALSIDYSSVNTAQAAVSDGCMALACEAVKNGQTGFCYDNLQVCTSQHVEQRPGAARKVVLGTAMILYPLRNATDQACLLEPILERRNALHKISFAEHIQVSPELISRVQAHQDIHIVEILLKYSSVFASKAESYLSLPILKHAAQRPPPSGHRTEQFPIRVTTTPEHSIDGNIEVWREAYENQLKMNPAEDIGKFAIPTINDQSTNANIRGAQKKRKFDNSIFNRLDAAQPAPGMFHVLLNTSWYLLNLHRGDAHDRGSLQSFITLLEKKRHGSEHPDYHALKATEMQVLDGLILHAWELECGFTSLQKFADSEPTPQRLLQIAKIIRCKHGSTPSKECLTDDIRHNTKLLMRDLLDFRTLHDAVKSGDFGRVEDLLGQYTTFYCGVGARNYCTEFLHLIQNLQLVWTPEFADVMRDNMLVNMSGRDGHWIGIDQNIEHNIQILEKMHTARGVHADFSRLSSLSPATHIWRRLIRIFGPTLGVLYKGVSHTEVDTSALVFTVRDKSIQWKLLETNPGREATKRTVDAIALGSDKLSGDAVGRGPLVDFHKRREAWIKTGIRLEDDGSDASDSEASFSSDIE